MTRLGIFRFVPLTSVNGGLTVVVAAAIVLGLEVGPALSSSSLGRLPLHLIFLIAVVSQALSSSVATSKCLIFERRG